MSLLRSGYVGTSSLHELKGNLCDLCGKDADSEVSEVVALDCTFQLCPAEAAFYHQACLEKYLKSIKCERNRKIGFPCPRGSGKGTVFSQPCPGKTLKSHPVSIRSEANKKRRQAELEQLQRVAQDGNERKKNRDKDEPAKAAAVLKDKKGDTKQAAADAKAKQKRPPAIKALNVANTSITTRAVPKTAAQLQQEQLAATARSLKDQIASRAAGKAPAPAGGGDAVPARKAAAATTTKTLDEYYAGRGAAAGLERASSAASASTAAPSVWGKSRANSGASLTLGDDDAAFPPPAPAPAAPRPRAAPAPAPAPVTTPRGAWAAAAKQAPTARAPAAVAAPAPADVPAAPPRAGAGVASAMGEHAAAAGADQRPIPGMVGAGDKLTKAQRKNARRAEKKARPADEAGSDFDHGSLPDSEHGDGELSNAPCNARSMHSAYAQPLPVLLALPQPLPLGDAAPDTAGSADSPDRCLSLMVAHKLQHQVDQLTSLGFPPAGAMAAVQRHAGNLEAAVACLLEQATGVQDGTVPTTAPGEVDLSEELCALRTLQARYGLAPDVLEAMTVEAGGDVDAVGAELERQAAALASYEAGGSGRDQEAQGYGAPQAQGLGSFQPVATGSLDGGWNPLGSAAVVSPLAPPPASSPGGAGHFSPFGFGGFAGAAHYAVTGGGGGLWGSIDSSSTQQAEAAGSSLWGAETRAASPLLAGSMLGSGDPLLSLLSLHSSGQSAGDAGLPGLAALTQQQQQQQQGYSQPLGHGLGQQQQHARLPYPGSSPSLFAPSAGGYGAGEAYGLVQETSHQRLLLAQQQQPQAGAAAQDWDPPGSLLWGSGGGGLAGAQPQGGQLQYGGQYSGTLEDKELSELMATLCR